MSTARGYDPMIRILFTSSPEDWPVYQPELTRALAARGIAADLTTDASDPAGIDFIVLSPASPITDFGPFTRARALLNLWAGVERIVGNPTITMPLCRMVDPAMTQGMIEYVTAHVLRFHTGMDAHLRGQDGIWRAEIYPPLASQRPVTVLGLGELGLACAQALSGLGFPVTGWSRSRKDVPGIATHHGEDGLRQALSAAAVVVLILPLTPETRDLMDATRIGWLPQGACIINPGRGHLIDDAALLAALDSVQVAQATLDVFRTEPLPPAHHYWSHPNVIVTPHIATATRPPSASDVVAQNIRRALDGLPLLHQVDLRRGY
jgi:glyoxylate/hydroxypyruvate reductase A